MGGEIEPGWYADPQGGQGLVRWWNGDEWTQHVRSLAELQGAGAAADADDDATADLSGAGGGADDEAT
ncbi:DUF2510 domain-containing protein, partial [Streptomonospora algeriensis]